MTYSGSQSCTFEQLEPRLLMSGSTGTASLFPSATLLNVAPAGSTTITSQITTSHQRHVYRFTAPARGRFIVEMTATDGDIDPYLRILNERGRCIRRNNNASGSTTNSRTRFGVKDSRTYYVLASSANDTTGTYTLMLRCIPRDDFGNNFASAKNKRLSKSRGSGRISGRINYRQDTDVFKITATQSGLMRVSQAAPGRRNALQGRLRAFNHDGTVLAESEQANDDISFDVVKGLTYYLTVAGMNDSVGRYRITIAPTLSYLFTTAKEVNLPSTGSISVSGNRFPETAADGYKFTTTARGYVYIRMTGDSGIDPYLRVFNSKTRRIAQNDNASGHTTDSRIRLRVRAGQTYFVEADTVGLSSGTYRLTFTSIPFDDIANTFEAARTVRLNRHGSRRKTGKINYYDDIDVLKLIATKTGTMHVDFQARGRGNNLTGRISSYDAQGRLLSQDTAGRVSFSVIKGRTYYVKVSSANGNTGRYRITISTDESIVSSGEPASTPKPAEHITTSIVSTNGVAQLLVIGTDRSDTITVSQSAGSMILTTASGVYTIDDDFSSVVVYGFGGQDVLRLDGTVAASAVVFAGAGDDKVFEAGLGASTLYGGAGNDLLVSVGGGNDTLYGGQGLDSFWVDGTDNVEDVSADETIGSTVHVIDEFYQPYTDSPGSPMYVSTEIAGQDLPDPDLTYYARGYQNFAVRPLFVDGPRYDDVNQGAVGDCYLLASLSSLADTDPNIIKQMIAPLGDGTYAVRFYRDGTEVYLRLDADLPVGLYGNTLAYAGLGPDGQIWVALIEKAYAYFRSGKNSYASIQGGWMADVFHEITNMPTTFRWTSRQPEVLYDFLQQSLSAGHAVTMGSYYDASGPIVGAHAYAVKSVFTSDGQEYVTVYNPWGNDGRTWDGNYADGLLTLSIDQVQQYFSAVVVSVA